MAISDATLSPSDATLLVNPDATSGAAHPDATGLVHQDELEMARKLCALQAKVLMRSERLFESEAAPDRLLRTREVLARVHLSKQTVTRMERAGLFPKRLRLSRQTIVWRDSEIAAWLTDPSGWRSSPAA